MTSGDFYVQGNDYFDFFGAGALHVANGEDWSNVLASRELAGWIDVLMRAATRRRGQPVHMHVIANSGRGPLEVKLKALAHMAQGTGSVFVYNYRPKYESPQEWGWRSDPR